MSRRLKAVPALTHMQTTVLTVIQGQIYRNMNVDASTHVHYMVQLRRHAVPLKGKVTANQNEAVLSDPLYPMMKRGLFQDDSAPHP